MYGPVGIRKMICTALELSRSPLSFILDVVELVPEDEQYPEGWEEWGTDMTYSNLRAAKQLNVREKWQEVKAKSVDKGDKYWEVFKTDDCDFIVRAGSLYMYLSSTEGFFGKNLSNNYHQLSEWRIVEFLENSLSYLLQKFA